MSLRTLMNVAGAVASRQMDQLLDREPERGESLPLGLGFNRLVSFDEVPFLLGSERGLQVTCPGSSLTVLAHGRIQRDQVTWHRFYLSDQRSMLQIGVDPGGQVLDDELRLFQDYDEVAPGSPEEWGFWLDPADGYIGYPEFQTKDQRYTYGRVWLPGPQRVKPLSFQERLATAPPQARSLPVFHTAMLYGRALAGEGREFMLVTAVERQQEAWVEIQVGMPLAPGYIQLT